MNGAELHLLLNHFPLFSMLAVFFVLVISTFKKNAALDKFTYILILFSTFFCVAAYLSGEGAERVIKNYPLANEALISEHERKALYTIYSVCALCLLCTLLFFLNKIKKVPLLVLRSVFLLASLLSLALIVQTSHLGGLIVHEEIRTDEFNKVSH